MQKARALASILRDAKIDAHALPLDATSDTSLVPSSPRSEPALIAFQSEAPALLQVLDVGILQFAQHEIVIDFAELDGAPA